MRWSTKFMVKKHSHDWVQKFEKSCKAFKNYMGAFTIVWIKGASSFSQIYGKVYGSQEF
jgi:hypothetical protein